MTAASAPAHAKSVTRMPSIIVKRRQSFGKRGRDQDGDVRVQRPLVRLQLRDPAVAPVARVLALPEDGAALRAPRVDDDLVDVGAADALSDGVDVVRGERAAEEWFRAPLRPLPLELLRPLVRLALQVFDLPAHLPELALFLGVFQAVLLGGALLGLGHQLRALLGQGPGNRDLEVRLLALQGLLALAQRQLHAPGLVQLLRLVFQLPLQAGELLGEFLLRPFRGVLLHALAVGVQLPLVFVAQLALALAEFGLEGRLNLGAQGARQGDFLAAGRAGDFCLP